MKLRTIARTLIASMLVGMLGIAPAAADDTAASEPVVMSFSQNASNTTQYTHPVTKAGSGWQYASIGGGDCVKLTYHETEDYTPYCYMPKFVDDKMVTDAHKYVCLVFMTTEPGQHSIKITNALNDESVVLATDTYMSAGKWVTTAPVEISSSGILSRFINGWHSAIEFTAEHEDAQIYLKEMVFFTSAEQADSYFGEDTGSVQAYPAPTASLKLCFGNDNERSNVSIGRSSKQTYDPYEFVTKNGVNCAKLLYNNEAPNYGCYNFMASFNKAGLVGNNKWIVITYMTTSAGQNTLTYKNGANGADMLTFAEDTSVSAGKWVSSTPLQLSETMINDRLNKAYVNMRLEWSETDPDAEIYIREYAFFATEEEAKAYTAAAPDYYNSFARDDGSTAVTNPLTGIRDEVVMDFSNESKMEANLSVDENVTSVTEVTHNGISALKINYTEKYSLPLLSFTTSKSLRAKLTGDTYYVAVTYMTDAAGELTLQLGSHFVEGDSKMTLTSATTASDKWATVVYGGTTPLAIGAKWLDTLKTGKYTHPEKGLTSTRLQLRWDCSDANANIYVKEMVFFARPEDAVSYASKAPEYYNDTERSTASVTINIGDVSLENYRIVISNYANSALLDAAKTLQTQISELIGKKLPIVTDDTPASEYEILVGKTDRPESDVFYGEGGVYSAANAADVNLSEYRIKVIGKKLVFASGIMLGVQSAADDFIETYFHDKLIGTVSLSPNFSLVKTPTNYTSNAPKNTWAEHINVTEPAVFTEDFTADNSYFTEEDAADNWKYENGALVTTACDELALSYIHVYEYNAAFESDFTYKNASDNAQMGITLRYTAEDAYIRVGYDFRKGEWYIDTRESYDFDVYRVASQKATLTPDTVYRLSAKVDGNVTTLTVNDTEVLRADATTQVTPGRVGVYAKGVDVSVDNVKLTLLSGEGTILQNVNHTIVGKERATFVEGASALEMNDGSILLTRNSSFNFVSQDDGITWESVGTWTDYETGHPNFLRLANGDWFKLNKKSIDGVEYMVAELSSDDGLTWRDGGIICTFKHDETGKPIQNMNDMVTQVRSGRIFVSMTYASSTNTDIWYNFVIFYYSDDNGMTWHKSLDSRYIEGNAVTVNEKGVVPTSDKAKYFAESRIIQCADGRIRMLNSWNNYGCFVYCDSFDNGETWGPLVLMEEFSCNRSSFAIARDKQADNDTTYYMVWCYDIAYPSPSPLPRSRFALAKSTDGMNWEYIGDVWRWESADCVGPNPANGNSTVINHIVDPAITVTEDNLIIGSGISEYTTGNHTSYHNVQLQHIWTIAKDTLPADGKVLNRFTDVDAGASYNNAISYAVENNLFQGMSATAFEPNTVMNREMFVTVLGRLEGIDRTKYTGVSFTDVAAGSWYAPYVDWASTNGVVSGMGDGTYGIGADITVQQACLMLYRYSNGKTAATSTGVSISDFADAADAADWAKEGVEWALENGIYAGQNGSLTPGAPASRALVATMFYNYVTVFGR